MTKPPHGFLPLTPYFTVQNADKLIEFAVAVFGARVLKVERYNDGRVQHARLELNESLMMLNQATSEFAATVSQMHLYVHDVEAIYEQALNAGATSTMKPMIRPHGDRMAGFIDPERNVWWIASAQQTEGLA